MDIKELVPKSCGELLRKIENYNSFARNMITEQFLLAAPEEINDHLNPNHQCHSEDLNELLS